MIDPGAMLKSFIYLISSSLLYPVLLLLVMLTLLIILYGGSFFAEWVERLRLKKFSPRGVPAAAAVRAFCICSVTQGQ